MDFAIKKRTGFLVNFAWKGAKGKEVPVHVYEHTLSRLGSAMPAARVYPAVVSDAHRGAPRLGDVSEQANGVRRVPNDPSRYAGVSPTAAPLRPLLQLLQPFWLDGARPGPSGRRGRGRWAQPARPVVSGRRRHAAAQTRQTRLRLGLV